MEGIIYKATGGFYYVYCAEEGLDLTCRARGLFRKDGRKPVVGDRVTAQRNEDGSGTLTQLLPRKNALIRPPLANLDYMVVVASTTDPAPNLLALDKYLAILEHKDIPPILAITKEDLGSAGELEGIYRGVGYPVYVVNARTREGIGVLVEALAGRFSAFSGNSGVGKSSLLNAIDPALGLTVGDTSKKLGRGRHTTRHVETHRLPGGGFVADTPGFTSLELEVMSGITKEELADCFREFRDYASGCRFPDCSHRVERDCKVLEAVAAGKIAPSRHENYCRLYGELKDVKDWERRAPPGGGF